MTNGSVCALLIYALSLAIALGQGQDGTPAQRNLQIIAELLPGRYDNANQAYFDQRLGFPATQPTRMQAIVARVDRPDLGAQVFSYEAYEAGNALASLRQLWALETTDDTRQVRMRVYDLHGSAYLADCDVLWRREAGQFTGEGTGTDCLNRLQLSPDALWVAVEPAAPAQLNRARRFDCYVDMPGVAGGRDEPFERYWLDDVHDQGGLLWFRAGDSGREIGIALRKVDWPMNNEADVFTRDSLVMYVLERTADGIETHAYGWTEPDAERIGLNLQWLLVNCYRVSNREVRPTF